MDGYLRDLFSHWLLVAPYVRYLERQIEKEKAAWAGLDKDARYRSAARVKPLERAIKRELPVVGGKPWDPDGSEMNFILVALANATKKRAEAMRKAR